MCQTDKEIKAKEPKRPFANFAHFCIHKSLYARLKPGVPFYPCLICLGRGRQYHPDSQTDPVEGNRHRETVQCEGCKGTGESTKKVCFKAYREVLNRWQIAVTIFKAHVTRRQRALAKLTQQEIEALKVLGL